MWWPRAGSRLRPLRRASSLALASRDVEGLRLYLWTEPTHPQKDQAKVQPPPMLSENPGSLHVGVSSSELSPQSSSQSHSWWGSTQALFPQW